MTPEVERHFQSEPLQESRYYKQVWARSFQTFEQFYPERMASRILGMGDVLSMIEKAQENIDEEQAKKLEQKMRKNEFDFEMYLDSMSQMKKMGGLSSVMGMMPGMGIGGGKMPDIDTDEAEKGMARTEAIIYSMTPEERRNPKLLNSKPQGSYCKRSRRGCIRGQQTCKAV